MRKEVLGSCSLQPPSWFQRLLVIIAAALVGVLVGAAHRTPEYVAATAGQSFLCGTESGPRVAHADECPGGWMVWASSPCDHGTVIDSVGENGDISCVRGDQQPLLPPRWYGRDDLTIHHGTRQPQPLAPIGAELTGVFARPAINYANTTLANIDPASPFLGGSLAAIGNASIYMTGDPAAPNDAATISVDWSSPIPWSTMPACALYQHAADRIANADGVWIQGGREAAVSMLRALCPAPAPL